MSTVPMISGAALYAFALAGPQVPRLKLSGYCFGLLFQALVVEPQSSLKINNEILGSLVDTTWPRKLACQATEDLTHVRVHQGMLVTV
jgi:membrane associated rhomboid family serine protease